MSGALCRAYACTMDLTRRAGLLILLSSLAAACSNAPADTRLGEPFASEQARYTVTVATTTTALHVGANAFRVHVVTAAGAPARLVRLAASMPAHGHSASATEIAPREGGDFDVSGLDLSMTGQWFLTLGLASSAASAEDDTAAVRVNVE